MESITKELIHAARDGNLEKVKQLLNSVDLAKSTEGDGRRTRSKRLRLNTMTEIDQFKILTSATEYQQTDVVKFLLDKGFTMDHTNHQLGLVPLLHVAIRNNGEEIVKVFLNLGVDPNLKDHKGSASLCEAVRMKNISIVKLLLDKGANINLNSSPSSTTAIIEAAQTGQIEMINLLLDSGADAYTEPIQGQNALSYAVNNNHFKALELFLNRGIDINSGTTTALCSAVGCNNVKLVDYLLEQGARADVRNGYWWDGLSAFHLAAKLGQVNNLKKFLKQNIDINLKNDNSETALHAAVARNQNLETVKFLLQSGIDVNAEAQYGTKTALERVLYKPYSGKSEALIMLLIDYKADFNAIRDGRNILERCGFHQDFEKRVVMLLRIFARLKSENIVVSEHILRSINRDPYINYYFHFCERELMEMKGDLFKETNLSLYDLLQTRSTSRLIGFARNADICAFFKTKYYKTKYSGYAETFKYHFEQYIERQNLLENVKLKTFFRGLLDKNEEYLPALPGPCADAIFSYLSMDDLLNLVEA